MYGYSLKKISQTAEYLDNGYDVELDPMEPKISRRFQKWKSIQGVLFELTELISTSGLTGSVVTTNIL